MNPRKFHKASISSILTVGKSVGRFKVVRVAHLWGMGFPETNLFLSDIQ